jgi:fibro-slime domain-containing protein
MVPRTSPFVRVRLLRNAWKLAAGLLIASGCGGTPSVAEHPPDINTKTGGSAGTSSGTGGSTNNGSGGTINVGDMGGEAGATPGSGGAPEGSTCGNGKLEPGELCDDGNTKNGDGCSADCSTVDPNYVCITAGQPCVRVVTCGNGVIEGDEACDDGNTKSGDGCSKNCSEIEPGYACVKPGEACVLLPVCGNGVREKGEQCDDGNTKSGDGCSSKCEQEAGYFCPPGQPCVPDKCGDGNRTPDEQCDDGNTKNGDGCSSTCMVESGWECSSAGCRPICGDGVVEGDEGCDDGNTTSGDGCSSACKVEPFYQCNTAMPSVCTSTIVCGDGILEPGEVCDPGITGESACYGPSAGASSACQGYDTGLVNPPVCNNGVVEYGEGCDGAVTGCTDCKVDPGYVCPAAGVCFKLPVCGDGILQAGEQCDVGLTSGPGCVSCQIQPNYFCSGEPSVCVASVCGDGIRAPNEQCDDHNTANGDGCSSTCTVETGWACPPSTNCLPVCGDGIVVAGVEQCDPTTPNTTACTNCKLNAGYTCGTNGLGPCKATVCGNATPPTAAPGTTAYINTAKASAEPGEGCDDGNTIAGDGCGPTCQLEPVVTIGVNPSVAVTCGDGLVTGSEQCDDGNLTDGDGCDHNCQTESGWMCSPSVSYPDSIAFKITYRNFEERDVAGGHPHMKVNGSGTSTGFPNGGGTPAGSPAQGIDPGITGDVCTTANTDKIAANVTNGTATCGKLDTDGKPLYVGNAGGVVYNGGAYPGTAGGVANVLPTPGMHPTIDTTGDGANLDETYHKKAFKLWYNDSNSGNLPDALSQAGGTPSHIISDIPNPPTVPTPFDTLTLTKTASVGQPTVKASYQFSKVGFFPLDGRGNNAPGQTHNFQFTSELRYFFQYQGGETLTFFGDDDVWVFINGRLAVDIGGIHGQLDGRVVLGDDGDGTGSTDSDCSVQGANNNNTATLGACALQANENNGDDKRFGLTKGGVYEIVVFQAERHPTGSNYQLTLDGFLAPRSFCQTNCGDGIRAGSEECDSGPGMPSTGYGVCLNNCTIQFCGDGVKNGTEACDNGTNGTLYSSSNPPVGCAPGCTLPAYCGDDVVQPGFNEQCDLGTSKNTGAYGGCTNKCQLGPYCGDGTVQAPETCDTPGQFTTYANGPGKCNYNCQAAPYCGDGIRNGTEVCDGTANCNSSCSLSPYCGDGIKETGEQCDNGMFNADPAPYDGCTTECTSGPDCGDGIVQAADGEECDNGSKNADNTYGACTTACLLGPRCGDGVVQKAAGEACDNGFNQDQYEYPGDMSACGPNCQAVPYCGDGIVQSAFELCDNGKKNSDTAYNGCTTSCDYGPYCGDGIKNGPEQCDNGAKNTAYSADGKGCSYDCTTDVPYCGDGIRNGPEQCDNGTAQNTGKYGGCNADCTRAAYCGDGIVQKSAGEQCDDGPTGSLTCTPQCQIRQSIR